MPHCSNYALVCFCVAGLKMGGQTARGVSVWEGAYTQFVKNGIELAIVRGGGVSIVCAYKKGGS